MDYLRPVRYINIYMHIKGYFKNLFWAAVTFIFPQKIFVCTFYAMLLCFRKHDKRVLGWCKTFSYILAIFYSIFGWHKDNVMLFFHWKNKTSFKESVFLFPDKLYFGCPKYDVPKICIELSQST